jgi:hypothetical protein
MTTPKILKMNWMQILNERIRESQEHSELTPEDLARIKADAEAAVQRAKLETLKHSTNDYTAALEYDIPDPIDAKESDDIQAWLADNFDDIPPVEF